MEFNRTDFKELLQVRRKIRPTGVLDMDNHGSDSIGRGNLHIGNVCLYAGQRIQPVIIKPVQMYPLVIRIILDSDVFPFPDSLRAPSA